MAARQVRELLRGPLSVLPQSMQSALLGLLLAPRRKMPFTDAWLVSGQFRGYGTVQVSKTFYHLPLITCEV